MRLFLAGFIAFGCNSNSGMDAASDAIVEGPAADLCDLDAFFAVDGSGGTCAYASPRLCFQPSNCPTTGCKCATSPDGPRWKCMTDMSCFEAGADGD